MTVRQMAKVYIESDRQWPRRLRLAHAKYQLRGATDQIEREFWGMVIAANA